MLKLLIRLDPRPLGISQRHTSIDVTGVCLPAPVVKRELDSFLDFVRRRDAGQDIEADEDEDREPVKTAV
ncbi:hypothetical protein [Streptomyces sp. NPDC090445]|uniref:hypothetical protein n=1 Tax=Streptomyces sp. NPDC090445 TaxID=3365963 RepID=UPI0037F660DD